MPHQQEYNICMVKILELYLFGSWQIQMFHYYSGVDRLDHRSATYFHLHIDHRLAYYEVSWVITREQVVP